MVGILDPSSAPQVQTDGVVAEPKGQKPLFKVDKYNGSTSLETHLLQFKQLDNGQNGTCFTTCVQV